MWVSWIPRALSRLLKNGPLVINEEDFNWLLTNAFEAQFLIHDRANEFGDSHILWQFCECGFAEKLREIKMTESDKENALLFGVQPTRIPVGDVIRAKRTGFGRLEVMRIDKVSREERLNHILKVEKAITFLQSFRAGAKQSLDIELYELNEEERNKQIREDMKYIVKSKPVEITDKKADQLAKALETLGLSAADLKKLKS